MTTYATLKADIATWFARDDLSSVIPTFVRNCEANLRRKLRTRSMETTANITITDGSGSLPSGFLEVRRVMWDVTGLRGLEFVSPQQFYASSSYDESGNPDIFTLEGSTILVRPSATGTVKIHYFAAMDALSGETDTNTVLTNHYDLYLYGSLLQAVPFVGDDERVPLWNAAFSSALDELNRAEERSRRLGPIKARASWSP